MSKSIQRFLSAIFSVLIAAIAIIIVLSELSFDVSALITGLGLGGLTIALAAKDTASNFFAGLVLVIEKPFDIGDWISCDIADGHIEGTVEDINLRSTMIRTGPGALTVVPNSSLGNAAITNWSGGMNKRLSDIELFFTYDTSRNSLDQYMQSVRNMLKLDPEIVADSGLVQFHSITNNGLGIKVRYYTAMPGYSDYLRIRERINFSLISLAGQYGLTFSFPTQTNIVQNKSSNEISS